MSRLAGCCFRFAQQAAVYRAGSVVVFRAMLCLSRSAGAHEISDVPSEQTLYTLSSGEVRVFECLDVAASARVLCATAMIFVLRASLLGTFCVVSRVHMNPVTNFNKSICVSYHHRIQMDILSSTRLAPNWAQPGPYNQGCY